MRFDIDPTTHVPLYQQLIGRLKHAIVTNQLKPGDQLPTVRELADELRVNFNTVARAYRLLDEQGYISTQHGRGTFILGPVAKPKKPALRKEEMQTLTKTFLANAKSLGYSPEEAKKFVARETEPGKRKPQGKSTTRTR